jgi:hypothetical protein
MARRLLTAMAVSLLIGLAAFSSLACDPSHAVTYDNRTSRSVTIFMNGEFNLSLGPMEKKTGDEIEFSEATFEARDSDGRVIYSETFTWEQLKEAGWRIVITEPTSGVPTGQPAIGPARANPG